MVHFGPGFVFVLTWGDYSEYTIGMVTTIFHDAVMYFKDWSPPLDKRIEVWLREAHVGNFTEVVASAEWDVNGQLQETKGLKWEPIDAEDGFEPFGEGGGTNGPEVARGD